MMSSSSAVKGLSVWVLLSNAEVLGDLSARKIDAENER